MSLEHHHAEAVPGRLADRGDPGAAGLDKSCGWLLVQRDWSLRQREPRPGRALAELRRRVAAVAAWLRRLVRGTPGGTVQDTAP
ncbi:MAG TPA: hypothetical protein VHT91_11600 [Kofleriaceae bacterium]|jgi:hypothetical protein|nr:hypothetical protein [Kofleriaceae bacterium]